MAERTRAWRRKKDWSKARRKRRLCLDGHWDHKDWYDNLHQYSKNKIHCSCPMCSEKTRDRRTYGKKFDPPVSWKRRVDEMEYEIKEEIE